MLSSNQISNIEPETFNGLSNLQWLYLDSNIISCISPGDFRILTNLTVLNLEENQISSIEPGDFSGLTNLTDLYLSYNDISSIEMGDFDGLTNLARLDLSGNEISNIEAGSFSKLSNLTYLNLANNKTLTMLNLAEADLSSLTSFFVYSNKKIDTVPLRNAHINQTSLSVLLDGGGSHYWEIGIGELDGITELDLSGIDFVNITDLSPLYVMDHLTDLWLVDTQNLDAFQLDLLLNKLATIESPDTKGILYMTQANFDAFNTAGGGLLAAWDAEPGHHVEIVIPEPASITLLLTFTALALAHFQRKWRWA